MKIFLRKRALTSKGEKNTKDSIIRSTVPKGVDFFRKVVYRPTEKKSYKCWACKEVGHYGNKCKNRKIISLSEIGKFRLFWA